MDEIATGNSTQLEPFLQEARSFVSGAQDADMFAKHLIRLIGEQDVHLPGESWTYINEMFYAVEEHIADPESRKLKGGLDEAALRRIVASQLPALDSEFVRLQAEESGRPLPVRPRGNSADGAELLRLVRGLLSHAIPTHEFAHSYSEKLERCRGALLPELLAAAEAVQTALDHRVPEGRPRRLYDVDEAVLRARITAVEPRLSAAAEGT